MKKIWVLAGVLALAVPAFAQAEIVKTAALDDPRCQGICLYWWPKLEIPEGWEQDEAFSRTNNVNFIYPAGTSNMGIMAGALTADNQAETLEGFIADDREGFVANNPGMTAEAGPPMTTKDGQVLQTLLFNPADDSNWDITAYGEETDAEGNRYYLTFSLSTQTKADRDKYLPTFIAVVSAYHK